MKCPVCRESEFEQKTVETGLEVSACMTCNGYWIKSLEFWIWRDTYNKNTYQEKTRLPFLYRSTICAIDSSTPKLCPECFKLLSRYEVGKGTNITIDRCETCRGMWLDRNKWELLVERDLHSDIHKVFSPPWQSAIKMEKIFENRAEALKRELGNDDYKTVDNFFQWIKFNKKKTSIMAFLNSVS